MPRYLHFVLQVLAQLPGKQTALRAMMVSEWHGYLICQPVQKKQMNTFDISFAAFAQLKPDAKSLFYFI